MLRLKHIGSATLDFSYKDHNGYILNPSGIKYKYSPFPLRLYPKANAFLLNSTKLCRPQTSWHYFLIPVSPSYQPCLRSRLYNPHHALGHALRGRKPSSIAADA